MTRVLVVTGDPLLPKMAGPAIRAFHMASALSDAGHDVRLVSTLRAELTDERFPVLHRGHAELRPDAEWCEVLIFQGSLLSPCPWLRDLDRVLVADLYDPTQVELLEQTRTSPGAARDRLVRATGREVAAQLARCDFFVCASDVQRHFWLGQLAAHGRLSARTYDADPTLRALIDVVPFGLPDEPATRHSPALRSVVPGIGPDDAVAIWGGGIYDWFDPLTVIEAVGRIATRHDDVRLFFLGTSHPNETVAPMSMVARARELSDRLGLTGRHVFFNEGWVDYERRADYLLDADVAVSAHADHLETELSFRTRILDYLWAGLPIVASDGDTFADLIARRDLGRVVPAGDVASFADALEACLYDAGARERYRSNVAAVRPDFAWSRTLAPLLRFCAQPRRAADAVLSPPASVRFAAKVERDAGTLREYLADGGAKLAARKAAGRFRRR